MTKIFCDNCGLEITETDPNVMPSALLLTPEGINLTVTAETPCDLHLQCLKGMLATAHPPILQASPIPMLRTSERELKIPAILTEDDVPF